MEELSNQEDNFDDLPALDDAPLDFGDDQMNLDEIDLESGVMDSDSLPELDLEGSADFDTDDADTAMDFSVDDVGSPADIADDFQVFDDDGDEPDMFADDSADMTTTDDQSAFLDDETFADDFESVSDSDTDAGLDLEMDGSFDELSSEVSADPVEADATDDAGGFQPDIFDEDEDDSIALSPDELDNILSNSDDDLFEDMSGDDATEAPSGSEGYDAVAPIDDSELSAPSDESDLVPTVDLEPIAPSDDTESVDLDMGFDDFADSDLSDVGAEPAYDDDSMDTDGFAD
ncbi:MAG: hypothetical protein KDK34_13415, partial [Leptospiraceae bacterium]|nr:hypothetical protein [Leptospiraceae bacterium]